MDLSSGKALGPRRIRGNDQVVVVEAFLRGLLTPFLLTQTLSPDSTGPGDALGGLPLKDDNKNNAASAARHLPGRGEGE